ncbi:MAG: hypothetical protein FJ194_08390 [Gammaproteobacteria bacterium]|nr:hypothetical protein [Gammaproteobacteria bacterium]
MGVLVRVVKFLLTAVIGIAILAGVVVFALRFGDGPTAIIAGGAFTSGETWSGDEPDWSFVKDREEVEFQLLDPERSRTTWIVEHEGRIYIPSGYMKTTLGKLWKQWPAEAEKDGRALLRVDDVIYPRTLVRVKESPVLPVIVSELERKYLSQIPDAHTDEAGRQAMREGAIVQIANDELWIFELTPR